jgi:hypothetical protein
MNKLVDYVNAQLVCLSFVFDEIMLTYHSSDLQSKELGILLDSLTTTIFSVSIAVGTASQESMSLRANPIPEKA